MALSNVALIQTLSGYVLSTGVNIEIIAVSDFL